MSHDDLIRLLDQRELRPKQCGPEKWEACCPAHEVRKASLAVGTGHDDRVLLHCHAGCDLADILASLNLTAADLFAPNGKGAENRHDQTAKRSRRADQPEQTMSLS